MKSEKGNFSLDLRRVFFLVSPGRLCLSINRPALKNVSRIQSWKLTGQTHSSTRKKGSLPAPNSSCLTLKYEEATNSTSTFFLPSKSFWSFRKMLERKDRERKNLLMFSSSSQNERKGELFFFLLLRISKLPVDLIGSVHRSTGRERERERERER